MTIVERTTAVRTALLCASVLLAAVVVDATSLAWPYGDRRGVDYNWQWRKGRATAFGQIGSGWTIHYGSCMYNYIYQDEPLGWDVAAMTDVHSEYVDSCGLCYEVACESGWTYDNYGGSFDRTKSCYDTSASVVVRIVDVCPCQYPSNAYSNKRWCCGDADHFDLSIWAFEKLAEERWGVIPIRYRPVPCDYQPDRKANPIPTPSPGEQPPAGATRVNRDWPEYATDGRASELVIWDNWYPQGIKDASWKTDLQSLSQSSKSGMEYTAAVCGKVYMGGALAFRGWNGMFNEHLSLEFWLYVGYPGWEGQNQQTPDLWVSISGNKGGCTPTRIINNKPIYYDPMWKPYATDYFWGWKVYLPVFSGWPIGSVINKNWDFKGCGGNSVWDLDTIEFRNDGWKDQWVCIDRIKVV